MFLFFFFLFFLFFFLFFFCFVFFVLVRFVAVHSGDCLIIIYYSLFTLCGSIIGRIWSCDLFRC